MKTWKATGCVLLAGIFWGSMGLFVRQLNAAGLYAIDVMQLRVLPSAIFVGLYLLLFDRQKLRLRPRDIWCFAGSGICSLMLFSWCYFTGMQAASLAVMAVLLYTAPVFVMLMSIVFFREKLTGAKLTALVLCLAGCVLVSGVGSSERLGLRGLRIGTHRSPAERDEGGQVEQHPLLSHRGPPLPHLRLSGRVGARYLPPHRHLRCQMIPVMSKKRGH